MGITLIGINTVPWLISRSKPRYMTVGTTPLRLGEWVRLTLPAGSRMDLHETRPSESMARFGYLSATVTVEAKTFTGTGPRFIQHTRHKLTRDHDVRTVSPSGPVRTATGLDGVTGDTAGPRGCYIILTAPRIGIVATITGVAGCSGIPREVRDAVHALSVTGP